ncbi:hypothetical protein LMH73_018470 [Vibrio splendidus]|nr:hypothetical protein [Vibrio splendidus]MCC4880328.1 hypothetical protein [Vibrio splendidus]
MNNNNDNNIDDITDESLDHDYHAHDNNGEVIVKKGLPSTFLGRIGFGLCMLAAGGIMVAGLFGTSSNDLIERYNLTKRNSVDYGIIYQSLDAENSSRARLDDDFADAVSKVVKKPNGKTYRSYFGVDKHGDRALVIAYHTDDIQVADLYKFSAKSVPHLDSVNAQMRYVRGDAKVQRVMNNQIFGNNHSSASEYIRVTDYIGYTEADMINYSTFNSRASEQKRTR